MSLLPHANAAEERRRAAEANAEAERERALEVEFERERERKRRNEEEAKRREEREYQRRLELWERHERLVVMAAAAAVSKRFLRRSGRGGSCAGVAAYTAVSQQQHWQLWFVAQCIAAS